MHDLDSGFVQHFLMFISPASPTMRPASAAGSLGSHPRGDALSGTATAPTADTSNSKYRIVFTANLPGKMPRSVTLSPSPAGRR